MGKGLPLFVLLLFLAATAEAISPTFESTIAFPGEEGATAVYPGGDGSCLAMGLAEGGEKAYLARFDPTGTLLWQRLLDGYLSDVGVPLASTTLPDGGLVVAGSSTGTRIEGRDVRVTKVDADGVIAWERTFGTSESDTATCVSQTRDGGVVIAGFTEQSGRLYVLRLSSDGERIWQKTWSGEAPSGALAVRQTASGGFVLAGVQPDRKAYLPLLVGLSEGGTVRWQILFRDLKMVEHDYWDLRPLLLMERTDGSSVFAFTDTKENTFRAYLVAVSDSGAVLWQGWMDSPREAIPLAMTEAPDEGIVIAGVAERTHGFVTKLDRNGRPLWQVWQGDSVYDAVMSLAVNRRGGYVAAGWMVFEGRIDMEGHLFSVDDDGNLLWERTLGAPGDDGFLAVAATQQGIALAGAMADGKGESDLYVASLDPAGNRAGTHLVKKAQRPVSKAWDADAAPESRRVVQAPAAVDPSLPSLVVATDATWPPFAFIDDEGDLAGFNIDLANAIAREARFAVELINVPWYEQEAGLEAGSSDVIISQVIVGGVQAEKTDISTPYVNAGSVIVLRSSQGGVTSLADLRGRTVGALEYSAGEYLVGDDDAIGLEVYEEAAPAFLALLSGQIDAVVAELAIAANYTRLRYETKDRLRIAGRPFDDELYAVAVKKRNRELLGSINAALKRLTDSGDLERLEQKWLYGPAR